MERETAQRIIAKLSWEIAKRERFLNLIARANQMKPKDREFVLKSALWVDGTVEGQVKYTMKTLSKLRRAYDRLTRKYG